MNELTTLHPTPWFAFLNQVADNKNQVVAETSIKGESAAAAKRIVECVNAMEGIENPMEFRMSVPQLLHDKLYFEQKCAKLQDQLKNLPCNNK